MANINAQRRKNPPHTAIIFLKKFPLEKKIAHPALLRKGL
jgi:hypothetical protein